MGCHTGVRVSPYRVSNRVQGQHKWSLQGSGSALMGCLTGVRVSPNGVSKRGQGQLLYGFKQGLGSAQMGFQTEFRVKQRSGSALMGCLTGVKVRPNGVSYRGQGLTNGVSYRGQGQT